MQPRFSPAAVAAVLILASTAACNNTVNVVNPPVPGAAASAAPQAAPSASAAPSAAPSAATPAKPFVKRAPVKRDDDADGPEVWDDVKWEDEVENVDWTEDDGFEDAQDLNVRDVDYWGGADEDGDGDTDYHALAEIDAGEDGVHRIEFDEDDQPLSSDELDVVTITDTETGVWRTFTADQEFNTFSVEDEQYIVQIEALPDGGFVIDGEEQADVNAAADTLMESPLVADASLHAAVFLHGVLERRAQEETRGEPGCAIGAPRRSTYILAQDGEDVEADGDAGSHEDEEAPADADGDAEATGEAEAGEGAEGEEGGEDAPTEEVETPTAVLELVAELILRLEAE